MSTVDMRRTSEYDVRIDRRTKWGNPFQMRHEDERSKVIELYREWLWREIKQGRIDLKELAALDGKTLGCWCAPKPCHGDVLAKAASWARAHLDVWGGKV